jgi:signal transduction histidine kinase/ligand-binding sensor domain-containing protein
LKRIGLCLLGLLYCGAVWSLESDLTLQQMNHRAFAVTGGVPSEVLVLAQATDGTLWVGGQTGLSRFDGIKFVRYPGPTDEALPSINISALFAAPDGGLWIGFHLGGVALLRAGHLTHYGPRDGVPEGGVWAFAWEHGTVWVAARGGLANLRGAHSERVASDSIPTATSLLVDRAGTLWVVARDAVLARVAGERDFREMAKLEKASNPYIPSSSLTMSPDGRVWATTPQDGVVIRMGSPSDPQPAGPRLFRLTEGGSPLLFDRGGNLWLAHDALLRVPSRELMDDRNTGQPIAPEKFNHTADGLSSDYVRVIFQDREANIWVGTNAGLDRFSRSNVVPVVSLPQCHGIGYAHAAGDSGTLWSACPRADSSTGFVTEFRDGRVVGQQDTGIFTAGYRDPDGGVWFAGPSGLGHLESGRFVTIPLPEQARGFDVQALARDRSGDMWVSVVRKGVYRFSGGQWSVPDAVPSEPAIVVTAQVQGPLWFGYPGNRIARLEGRAVQLFDSTHGLNVGNVTAIFAQGKQVWVGGELGFSHFDGTRFVPVRSVSGNLFTGVSGVVGTNDGDLWLNAVGGIVHVPAQEVDRMIRDPRYRVRYDTFDSLDGVSGSPIQLRPLPSALQTTDGRVWFAMSDGLVWIDPTHLTRNALVPPVTIWSISSAEKQYPNLAADLRLPIHTTSLQIDYTAGSLTIPERVHFRYKLEGSDREWQDVGNRREALYTNLGPGRYTFRVVASNNDGVWNNTGAFTNFTITPAFYQTKWFYSLCALVCLGILFVLYKFRVQQVAAQVRGRLEARLAERERIARELHDTLLQGVQGLIWRFQAVADRIPKHEPSRDLMERTLERADQVLGESRDRVKDLRASGSDVADLPQALAAEGEQLALAHPAQFRTSAEGVHRDLHPIVREEALLIAREALCNAFRHAGANHIEAEVSYTEVALQVRIRDDGQGISADVLDAGGRSGHFGLLGMRERAAKIRAHLTVWSKAGAGTEVDLRVPAAVAYRQSQNATRHTRSWRGILHRSADPHKRHIPDDGAPK